MPGFDLALGQLQREHEREIAALSQEVAELKRALAAKDGDVAQFEGIGDVDFEAVVVEAVAAAGVGAGPSQMVLDEPVVGETASAWRLVSPRSLTARSPTSVGSDRKRPKSHHTTIFTKAKVDEYDARSCHGRMRKFVEDKMDMLIGAVIVINVIFVWIELEVTGHEAGAVLNHRAIIDTWPDFDILFIAGSNFFALIFVMELLVKLNVMRGQLYYHAGVLQKFNIFDTLIVLATVVDIWIVSPMTNGSAGSSLTVIRLMRFIRVFRTLRIVRTFEVFSKLRVLVTTVIASFFALFWSLVLLSVVMLMAALIMCQGVNLIFLDETVSDQLKLHFFRYFGTPSRSLWTMFEITFGGGWQQHARPLVEEVNAWWSIFWVLYIAGVVFAMFKIITALFLKDTLNVAASDAEAVIQDKMKEKAVVSDKLREFFSAADTSGDGFVTWDEFEEILKNEAVVAYLSTLELDTSQSKSLFDQLDDGDRQVSVEEFVRGALRLKGHARSSDVVAIMHDCTKVLKKCETLEDSLTSLHARIGGCQVLHRFP